MFLHSIASNWIIFNSFPGIEGSMWRFNGILLSTVANLILSSFFFSKFSISTISGVGS